VAAEYDGAHARRLCACAIGVFTLGAIVLGAIVLSACDVLACRRLLAWGRISVDLSGGA
jgi:hypothetical protein